MMNATVSTDTLSPSDLNHSGELDAIVVGGGQAGLSAGYYLAKTDLTFTILDASARVGDAWRNRWDSLTLFTPAKYSHLPGLNFSAPAKVYPTKDQMADYLEDYARTMNLPVETGTKVLSIARGRDEIWNIQTTAGQLTARSVIVATGGYQIPNVPDWASDLKSDIQVLHSRDYRNPSQLKPGSVLVVGASHSGAEIAIEAAGAHHTVLAGRDVGQMPVNPNGRLEPVIVPLVWFLVNHVVTINTPVGRKARAQFRTHGFPLEHPRRSDIEKAGVDRVISRVTGAENGRPVLENGTVINVENVIFCTGFTGDYSWIEGIHCDEEGFPIEHRGIVQDAPGMYFVGLRFQQTGASSLVGGVGRDAKTVVEHLSRYSSAAASRPHSALRSVDLH